MGVLSCGPHTLIALLGLVPAIINVVLYQSFGGVLWIRP